MAALTEHVGLGEGAENGDLITKDFGRGPTYPSRFGINARNGGQHRHTQSSSSQRDLGLPVDNKRTATANVVDCVFENLDGARSLDHYDQHEHSRQCDRGSHNIPMSKP
jgi:hypothetical protein